MFRLMQEAGLAIRRLRKTPGFTLAVLLTLALGIGANGAVFSLLDQAMWRPLPFKDPDSLVLIHEINLKQQGNVGNFSAPSFLDFRRQTTSFSGLAAISQWNLNLSGDGRPDVVRGGRVSGNFFEVLGVQPQLGRGFHPEEEAWGAAKTVILSHEFWQRRFGGDASIVGRSLRLDGQPWQVVGVLPPGFRFPYRLGQPELFIPFVFSPEAVAPGGRGNHYFQAVGRLKPGLSPEQGAQDMARVMSGLAQSYPEYCAGYSAGAKPLQQAALTPKRRAQWRLLLGTAVMVLLIACVNVANLLIARGLSRRQELAVRASLGADRTLLVRQLMTESLALSVAGGALGLVVSFGISAGLVQVVSLPLGVAPELGLRTLSFLGLLTLGTCLLFGLLPAWQTTRGDLASALREGSKGSASQATHRLRSALVVGEVALATALLLSTGLMLNLLWRLQREPLGFQPGQILTGAVFPPAATHPAARLEAFARTLVQRLEASPSVAQAAVTDTMPMGGASSDSDYGVEGEAPLPPGEFQPAFIHRITPGFLQTLGIRLLAGRDVSWADGGTSCLISDNLARIHFPGQSPLGKRIRIGDDPWMEVVGVVDTVHQHAPGQPNLPHIYVPLRHFTGPLQVLAKAKGAAESLRDLLPATVVAVDGDLPLTRIRTMEAVVDQALEGERSQGALMAAFAGVALALALVGIYGLMSFVAKGRTRELGIRAALGANLENLLALLLGQGLRLVAFGLGLGLLLAAGIARGMASQVAGSASPDPAIYASVIGLLAATSLLACLIPAFRAASIQPAEALRTE